MAIIVTTNGNIVVAGTDLSAWARTITVNDGQESREVTTMGQTIRTFRAGLGTPSIEATFRNDMAAGGPEALLRSMITTTTSGAQSIMARKVNSATTTVNPSYTMIGILDGDLTVLNEEHGEVAEIAVRFVPYSTWTISTSAT